MTPHFSTVTTIGVHVNTDSHGVCILESNS